MTSQTASSNNNKNLLQEPQDLMATLNINNIFSQGSNFYQQINTAPTKIDEKPKSFTFDAEKTDQLFSMLSSIGIQVNTNDSHSEHTKIDPSLEIAVRAKEGIYFTSHDTQNPVTESGTQLIKDGNGAMHYSANGKYFLFTTPDDVIIRNLATGKEQVLKNVAPIALGFSSTGCYFFFINKTDKDKTNVHIYTSDTLERVFAFESIKYKKENWPYVQFNHEDTLCVYQTGPNVLQFKKPKEKFTHYKTLELKYMCDHFALSSAKSDPFIVTMSLEKYIGFSKTISNLEIFSTEDLSTPVISTVLEKAQEAKMLFSPAGTHLLLWVQTTHDETGKSYYGQTNLYYFDMRAKTTKLVPTYDGPIHDVTWNPNGMEFVVISGFMPAGSVLFDNLCTPKFEFGKHHRNTIRWSPLSRFLCLAGFGNLSGDIEVWDVYALKKVGQCKAHSAGYSEWSPDGRKIMTAVVFPRLRVDNGVKIFKYNGKLLNTIDYSKSELYEVSWRPHKFEDRPASPDILKEKQTNTEIDGQKPKRLFQPKGSMLSEMLKAGKQSINGPRVLEPTEDFGRAKALEEQEKIEAERAEENKDSRSYHKRKMTEDSNGSNQDLKTTDAKSNDSPNSTSSPAMGREYEAKPYRKKAQEKYAGPRRAAPNTNLEQTKPPDSIHQGSPSLKDESVGAEIDDKAFQNLVMQLNAPK